MRVKKNMFGEFNKESQLKTSLAKNSIKFNDLAVQMRPHRIAYLRLLGRPYTLLYVRRSVGRLENQFLLIWFERERKDISAIILHSIAEINLATPSGSPLEVVCPQTFSHTVMCKVCLTASNTLFDADAFVPLNH